MARIYNLGQVQLVSILNDVCCTAQCQFPFQSIPKFNQSFYLLFTRGKLDIVSESFLSNWSLYTVRVYIYFHAAFLRVLHSFDNGCMNCIYAWELLLTKYKCTIS